MGLGLLPADTHSQSDFMIAPAGTRIGRYKLLEKIGEGGFGVVFMAEQVEPVQRKVALKIIKAGMDTREVIARFEAERQAIALMDHPNIARALDAGATEAGRPYFVMELVRGIPITDYCDQKKLPTRERLELFMKVCQAVQHAHQKGVIHRDLKPSNVLVTEHDGAPVPKVIDFGVAKALGQKLTAKTLFTAFNHLIGTPAYMSPEQAALSGLDVDTRADIYSLGVLLYELLTGVTPFDAETFRKEAMDEVRRMIRETEPPKPSTRLQALGDKLAEVAKQRATEPAALNRLVRGDLDWIVMKCLEKDRQRRYETANALAKDLERHLNVEPVVARPPRALYQFQKLVRRHRLVFAATSAVVVSLIAGLGISTWSLVKEGEARRGEEVEARRSKAALAKVTAILVREDMLKAEELFKEDNSAWAFAHLARAMRLDTNGTAAAERTLSALVSRGIALPLPPAVRLPDGFGHADFRFSSDGSEVIAFSKRWLGHWNSETGEQVGQIYKLPPKVQSEWTSSDGRLRLILSKDIHGYPAATNAQVWDIVAGKALFEIPNMDEGESANRAEFSRNNELLTVTRFRLPMELWDVKTGNLRFTFSIRNQEKEVGVQSFAFSRDGQKLGAFGYDKSFRVWNVISGEKLFEQQLPRMEKFEFSPDGEKLLTISRDAVVWDIRTAKEEFNLGERNGGQVRAAHFSPDGLRVVVVAGNSGGDPSVTRVFKITKVQQDPTPLVYLKTKAMGSAQVSDIEFSSDGELLVLATQYSPRALIGSARTGELLCGTIRGLDTHDPPLLSLKGDRLLVSSGFSFSMLDARPGALRPIPLSNYLHRAASRIEFSPNGKWALAVSGNFVEALETKDWKVVSPPMPHGGIGGIYVPDNIVDPVVSNRLARADFYLQAAQISNDGQRAVTLARITNNPTMWTDGGACQIWDVRSGTPVGAPISMRFYAVIMLSPDGERLVVQDDKKIRIWNALTGQPMTDNIDTVVQEKKVSFSADSRFFIAGKDVWDAKAARPAEISLKFKIAPQAAKFSPDGRLLATENGVWEFPGGRQLITFSNISPDSIVFSPDGSLLATLMNVMSLVTRIWDVHTWQPTVPPLLNTVVMEFSSDNKHLLTPEYRVLDARTGLQVSEVMSVENGYRVFSFTPDGHHILRTTDDGTREWPIPVMDGPTPPWLPALVEVIAGQRLDKDGNYQSVFGFEQPGFLELKTQILQSTADDEATRWAKWFLADRATRPATPW